ncbi:MAG: glycosyltransferase [Planctomycetaceae bacterium]|nr:glycosyltransferase [Planctomycetaceae bacterium]
MSQSEQIDPPARAMRVAWVTAPQTLARLGAFLAPLAQGLRERGIEVTLLSEKPAQVDVLAGLVAGVAMRWRKVWSLHRGAIEAAAAQLARAKVDLVHALEGAAVDVAMRLGQRMSRPTVVSSYRADDLAAAKAPAELSLAAVMAASQPLYDALRAKLGEQVQAVLSRPGLEAVSRPRDGGAADRRRAIVLGGPLEESEPFEMVLESLSRVLKGGPAWHCFVLGGGGAERRLRRAAARLGLARQVTMVPEQPSQYVGQIMSSADLYVAPVSPGGVDLQCLQGMAAAAPILSIRQPACDFLIDGATASLFRSGDREDLDARLATLLCAAETAAAQAARALEYVRMNHSVAAAVEQTAAVYRTLAMQE